MNKIIERIIQRPQQSFFLFGPRGTGKSTWLRNQFPNAKTINLLDESVYQRYLATPGAFAGEVRTTPEGSWVVVDEIQRLPNLLNEAHRFIEERRVNFVLCGSSARKLKKAGVNLLAGRALRRFMHPFLPEELGNMFSLEKALQWGLLPIIWGSHDKKESLIAYSQMYLREEIQAESIVRNLQGFARFLPVAALLHGQTVNVTSIARDSGVGRTTVIGYLDILEDTLVGFRVAAYTARLRVRERRHPKWYWLDPGIVRAIKHQTGEVTIEERGPLFEGLVAQLIRAYRDYKDICDDFYYWAPAESRQTEVDFLLKRGNSFVAIEVKSGGGFSEMWCRGLRAIAGLDGLCRRIVVYPEGPDMKTDDGIEIVSFRRFSDMLSNGTIFEPA